MKKQLRRTASLALALTLMLALLVSVSVSAVGEKPATAHWEGTTATWEIPSSEVVTYEVSVQLAGNIISTVNTPNNYYDFANLMKNNGPGYYNFAVMAVYEGGVYSEMTFSDPHLYEEESKAHPHPLKYHEYKAPTCTENGNREYYECPVCDQYFIDSKGQELYETKGDVVLSATGHKWGDWNITKQPTATEEGEAVRYCEHDPEHRETKKLAKLGSPTDAATEAPKSLSTVPSTQPVTQPHTQIVIAPFTTPDDNGGGKLSLPMVLLIIGGVLIVAAAIIVPIIVVSNNKKKKAKEQMIREQMNSRNRMNSQNQMYNRDQMYNRNPDGRYYQDGQSYQDIQNYQNNHGYQDRDHRVNPNDRDYHDDFDNQN